MFGGVRNYLHRLRSIVIKQNPYLYQCDYKTYENKLEKKRAHCKAWKVPEREKESQLLLWLKGLSAYKDRGVKKKILGAKNHFIHELRSIYPTGIYQPKDFFTILYALTNPDLYFSACDWLRGVTKKYDKVGQSWTNCPSFLLVC